MKTALAIIISFALITAITASAISDEYEVTIIDPPQGYEMSSAFGLNTLGQVVGAMIDSNGNYYAFAWDNGTITILDSIDPASAFYDSGSWRITDDGKITGYSSNNEGNPHAVIWDIATGTPIDLHTGNVEGNISTTIGINSNGQVVGAAEIPVPFVESVFHAFIYDNTNGFQDLGTMNTSGYIEGGYSAAVSVNSSGEVVGVAQNNSWNFRPFIYTSSEGMIPLSIDPALSSGEWGATIINDNGLIGGVALFADIDSLSYPWIGTEAFPYIWNDSASSPVAITMPALFPNGVLCAVNNSGSMVGSMWNANEEEPLFHAFIYDSSNGLRDLNDLVTTDSDVVLQFAGDINEKGEIAGYALQNGIMRAFLLTVSNPELEGDANMDGVVNILDIAACINHITGMVDLSEKGIQNADMNRDSTVDILDVIAAINLILGM
ncbi:dockerin type I domain-containing protein [Desulfamplus magnetovallimortis]|nr:dockerin type I domain-containing protein [Desulfamplus magnetovallimortis]